MSSTAWHCLSFRCCFCEQVCTHTHINTHNQAGKATKPLSFCLRRPRLGIPPRPPHREREPQVECITVTLVLGRARPAPSTGPLGGTKTPRPQCQGTKQSGLGAEGATKLAQNFFYLQATKLSTVTNNLAQRATLLGVAVFFVKQKLVTR